MKKFTYIFLLASCLLLASCESWLDEDPQYTLNTQIQFSTSEKARAALYGCYGYFALTSGGYGQHWQEIPVRYSGFGWAQTNGGTNDMCGWLQCDYTDDLLTNAWYVMYKVINETNAFIANVESTSLEDKDEMAAEAHFLRALYYFNLVRLFGDVPLIKIQQTAAHDLQVHRAPKEQIYELIIQDLKDAASLLPAQYEQSSDIGRATKGASLGLLAKVYLTLKRYDDTISTIEELETLNVYSLNKKYDWNFDYSRENGPESLFEVQYEKDVTTYAEFDILGQGAWHNDYLAPLAPIAIGGRWGNFGWFAVYQEFVDSYEPGDLRKKVSVWCQGDQYKGWSYDPSCSQTGHNVKKFLCEDIGQDRAMDSPLNFPVLRYADVLLMYAEALNETGHTKEACAPATSYEEGGPLNRVRARAGLPNVDTEDQAELREIIRHERRMELAFEGGHRWFDLIRYDENGEYAKKFFHSIGKTNFTTPKHLLLPVPMDDIDANPNLRPNNPGY